MKLPILALSAVLLTNFVCPSASAEDQTIAYPEEKSASFLIDAPENWKLEQAEDDDGYFTLEGPTGAVLSFRTIKGTEASLDAAIDESIEFLKENYKEPDLQKPTDDTINGLKGFASFGTGKDKEDGTPMVFGMGWYALPDNKLAEVWFTADATDEKGAAAAGKIVKSLRAP